MDLPAHLLRDVVNHLDAKDVATFAAAYKCAYMETKDLLPACKKQFVHQELPTLIIQHVVAMIETVTASYSWMPCTFTFYSLHKKGWRTFTIKNDQFSHTTKYELTVSTPKSKLCEFASAEEVKRKGSSAIRDVVSEAVMNGSENIWLDFHAGAVLFVENAWEKEDKEWTSSLKCSSELEEEDELHALDGIVKKDLEQLGGFLTRVHDSCVP